MEGNSTDANVQLWLHSRTKTTARRPWTAVSSLTGLTLLLGILIAVGHHLFYHFLNGQRVDHIIPQTWVINIGTAMAFLCKTFLSLAAATAFVQCMFHELRRKHFKVQEVDSMSQMMGNPFELFFLSVWSKAPTACLIALVVWLIPVAAVFPPGTLSVAFPRNTIDTQEKTAMPDFANATKFALTQGSVANREYSDASASVYQAALASSSTGQVLNIPHSHVNMSYTTDFYAPAIQCGNASSNLTSTAASYLNGASGSEGNFLWVAFVGGDDRGLFNMTPCHNVTTQNVTSCEKNSLPLTWFNDTVNFVTLDTTSTDASRLYVWNGQLTGQTLLECKLVNASYNVNFTFGVNEQITTISKNEYQNDIAASDWEASLGDGSCNDTEAYAECLGPYNSTAVVYQSIMQAFNSLLVGALYGTNLGYSRELTLVQYTTIAQNYSAEAPFNDHLANDLETLFQNITLSMFSRSDLQADETDVKPTPVTIIEYPAIYHYRSLVLYLAYGLCILFAALCALAGLIARQDNGGSYTNKFSTYARVAVSAGLQDAVSSHDTGANPCPQDLRQTGIYLDDEQSSKG